MPRHVARGFCPACPEGEALLDVQWGTANVAREPTLVIECGQASGDTVAYALSTDSTGFSCLREPLPGARAARAGAVRSHSSASARAAVIDGRIYVRQDGLRPYLPLTLDHTPNVVEETPGGLVAIGDRAIFREVPELGIGVYSYTSPWDAFPVAMAEGKSSWLLFDDGHVTDFTRLGRAQETGMVAAPTQPGLKAPFWGTRALARDGRPFLVMSAFDAVLAADMSGAGEGVVADLEVKGVPATQVPILSLAVLPPSPDDASLLSGFVLTENRLFSFRALSDLRWDFQPLEVAEGEWMELWSDGRRGRIGYRDGSVHALPSGVRIAPPLGGGTQVRDYVHYCGRSFALTERSLLRLESTGGAEGAWEELALPALEGPDRWQRAFITFNENLWVFSEGGRGVALRGLPCEAR